MHKVNDRTDLIKRIQEADKILVGIGDDFEMIEYLKNSETYQSVCNEIADAECQWVMPYVNAFFLKDNASIKKAYINLNKLIEGKDYFIISACMNGILQEAGLCKQRIVEPCGSYKMVQKESTDGLHVLPVEPNLLTELDNCIDKKSDWKKLDKSVAFNCLYTDPYSEVGYQEQWQAYTKWLQGTLNRNLCILELGSSMMFASVLRFRFEKIVSLNKKANLIRVNKRLYQLPEQISDKGIAVSENAVEFMAELAKV